MAVFTELHREDIQQIVASFNAGELQRYDGIEAGSENTNYAVETSAGKFVLTLFEERAAKQNFAAVISIIMHLKSRKIPVPEILPADNGDFIVSHHSRPVVMQEWLEGDKIQRPVPAQCEASGWLMAKTHLAAEKESPLLPNLVGCEQLKKTQEAIMPEESDHQDLLALLKETTNKRQPMEGLPRGFIHADWFPDNIFYRGDQISGVIDFWFGCHDDWLYDLAIGLNAWGFDKGDFLPEHFEAFLYGYQSVRKLEDVEKKYFQQAMLRATVRFLTTRLYDTVKSKVGMEGKNPQGWAKRLAFHQERKEFADYV